MINYSVELSARALEDFRNLSGYEITHPGLNMSFIREKILSLQTMPERYPFWEENPWIEKQVRVMVKNGVCIFYYINKETKIVSVIRILYVQNAAVKEIKIV